MVVSPMRRPGGRKFKKAWWLATVAAVLIVLNFDGARRERGGRRYVQMAAGAPTEMSRPKQQQHTAGFFQKATEAVMATSERMPDGSLPVRGYDFNNGVNHSQLLRSFKAHGFQANSIALAIEEINKMIKKGPNCTIFLGYTSNMISCGNREIIRYLVEHNMVDAIVTTAGGIEEDIMKCMAPHYIGSFELAGRMLRRKGHNRIGNLIVPNENYVLFEKWMQPFLDDLATEFSTSTLKTISVPTSELIFQSIEARSDVANAASEKTGGGEEKRLQQVNVQWAPMEERDTFSIDAKPPRT
mmetsp:Transcript_29259/g.46986  ORF Transcript_29259/g.46986 Transcript_29259/m.46986 type:complete len:299 (+) Transcript_29259:66-962(+)